MTPELEIELRTTVASLRVKTSCQELPIMARLPTLGAAQKAAIHGCLEQKPTDPTRKFFPVAAAI
jgi:hypothetical protein